jgi:hypothetical protein
MDTLKTATIECIKQLPDGIDLNTIMYEIDFIGQVLDGLKDSENGRTFTTEELLRKVDSWHR